MHTDALCIAMVAAIAMLISSAESSFVSVLFRGKKRKSPCHDRIAAALIYFAGILNNLMSDDLS